MFAQSKGDPPASKRGWGSSWLEPANEQQRREQALVGQIRVAEEAGDSHTVWELAARLTALEPIAPGPHMVRAWVYRQRKQFGQALREIDQARDLAQRKDQRGYLSDVMATRALVHEMQKDLPAAVTDFQASLRLNDKDPQTINSLAWLRATAPDPTLRAGSESVRLVERAVALSTKDSYLAIDTLAAAYAESHDYPRAVDAERRAMTTAQTQIKDAAKARAFQKGAAARLQLFEQHQAYHADLP